MNVTPSEAASRSRAIVVTNNTPGTAKTVLNFPSGTHDIAVNYFDHLGGRSKYELFLNGTLIRILKSDLEGKPIHDFSEFLAVHSATRITFPKIKGEKGDMLQAIGQPDGKELAPLDYVSMLPQGMD